VFLSNHEWHVANNNTNHKQQKEHILQSVSKYGFTFCTGSCKLYRTVTVWYEFNTTVRYNERSITATSTTSTSTCTLRTGTLNECLRRWCLLQAVRPQKKMTSRYTRCMVPYITVQVTYQYYSTYVVLVPVSGIAINSDFFQCSMFYVSVPAYSLALLLHWMFSYLYGILCKIRMSTKVYQLPAPALKNILYF
jgi:hypothetical protein